MAKTWKFTVSEQFLTRIELKIQLKVWKGKAIECDLKIEKKTKEKTSFEVVSEVF